MYLQIFHKIDHNAEVGFLHPLPESVIVEDLSVSPDLVQGDLPEVLGLVAVGGDEAVSEYLPRNLLLYLETVCEEIHETMQEVFVSGPGELQDVRILLELQLPGVDEVDDGGQGLLSDLLHEDLALAGLLHGGEDGGPEHGGSGAEDGLVHPELLGLAADGEVSRGLS